MGLRQKVTRVLERSFRPDRIDLEERDGVYGYVVSTRFRRKEMIDRQKMIDRALRGPSSNLDTEESRRVLFIAALTPEEYEFSGLNPANNGD